jgi:uncharacterized SAM-binding protein YcdF (DUF218 family)
VVHVPLLRTDAIVLLAGAFRERAPGAARLYREGTAPLVILTNDGIFSSWSQKHQRNLYNIEWATELLVAQGVPRSAIVHLPFHGSGTIYDALATREYVQKNRLGSLLLVTSDYHTRRALWTFRRVFGREPVTIGIVPVDSPKHVWFRDLGRMSWELLSEFVKSAYYFIRFDVCRTFSVATTTVNRHG